MKVHLISFASPNFYKSQHRLNRSAVKFGVNNCISFTFNDLIKTRFYQENKEILDMKRGAGYWLWKPYIILEAMHQAADGDIIFYCDSGAEIIADIKPLVKICIENNGLLLFKVPFFGKKLTNINWTKRDCFVLMNADTPEYHEAEQTSGTFQLFIKNDTNKAFVEEWLSLCKDPRLITDMPNTCGLRNYPDFYDHRHDQSILSILAHRKQIDTYRDPSKFANHFKMVEFREANELPPDIKYSSTPCKNSPYGTLINHHRERKTLLTQKLFATIKKIKSIKPSPSQQVNTAKLPSISIGITTFANRFEDYFKPLLTRIREFDKETEIIVAINGENNQAFSETYRKDILPFLARHKNVFPIVFPQFRGVSKLWNTIIVHASHDFILMLNDDIMIHSENFVTDIKKHIALNNNHSFTINKSWSHFLISRAEIDYLGYFDERFLGIGEEDGDISWRYFHEYRQKLADFKIKYFDNFAEDTVYSYKPTNITRHSGTKYSKFNRNFIQHKYQNDQYGSPGLFGRTVRLDDPGPEQYPNEKFYHKNKNKL